MPRGRGTAQAPDRRGPRLCVPLERARACWIARQGFGRPGGTPLPGLVAETGWIRTLGGADVYLALRARAAGLTRSAVDAESAALRLRVLPAVRGCTYLVPAPHATLALRTAADAWRPRTEREVAKAGASWAEVERCAAAVTEVLQGPATTDGLRRALPKDAVRSLGEAGRKVGLSSLLPVALRLLELEGLVERTLEGGRLDTERYLWRRSGGAPDAPAAAPDDPTARHAELLRLFLSWAGPATAAEFAAWSGLALRDARAAARLLDVVSVAVEDGSDEALLLATDVPTLLEAPSPNGIRLLSFEDLLLTLHGGPGPLARPEDRARPVAAWGSGRSETLGSARHLSQRTILAAGTIAGFWELDADAGRVVTASFRPLAAEERRDLEEVGRETAHFLLEEVGHGRSFSLDTDEEVRRRARALGAI